MQTKRSFLAAAAMFGSLFMVGNAAAENQFAVIYNNAKEDGGFNQAAFAGVTKVQKELSLNVRERVTGSPEETGKALAQFAKFGVQNLLTLSFLNEAPVSEQAKAFPDIRFAIIDGFVDLPNVRSIVFKEDEAGFLAGAAAGLATKSDVVGFIGGMPIPPIDRYGCGFVQGVKATNPRAVILWRYIGDTPAVFRDREGAKQAAKAQLDAGADIVFPATGFPGEDAIKLAASSGAMGIGVDVNQNALVPGKVLTSAVKRVDTAAYLNWAEASQGTWKAGLTRLGLAEAGVDWSVDDNNRDLVAPIADKVEALRNEIVAGTRSVADYQNNPECTPKS